ncbi:MAG TPA: hypothetical protein VNT56_10350, partial [Acidimicrobiales bacterium]|nr:hypothetical protein [Acidimicrobiales bacterium]
MDHPGAGRLVGALVTALIERGDDAVVEHHLGPAPEDVLEVATYRIGSLDPVAQAEYRSMPDALRAVLDGVEPGQNRELVRWSEGDQVSVFARLGTGPLVCRLDALGGLGGGEPGTGPPPAGGPAEVAEALRRALADTTIEVDLGNLDGRVSQGPAEGLGDLGGPACRWRSRPRFPAAEPAQ